MLAEFIADSKAKEAQTSRLVKIRSPTDPTVCDKIVAAPARGTLAAKRLATKIKRANGTIF